ncbi:MAG: sigma-70 family RNA polymerase sigma factor [Phycisphaeraceae bacterium]|nr:sigma-70 family RNA polymerase sigma factor [Phycisphaeraceae bacterium]MBX3407612.1 sigma-70 family RNA polymerase sigma factor [Phycisphaeraceae bacterium]
MEVRGVAAAKGPGSGVSGRAGESPAARGAIRTRLSPDEFAALFSEHGRLLWCAAAATLSGRAGAEDMVQQAAMIALSRLGDFDPGTSFAAWMTQIVRNVAMNEARKTHRRRTSSVDGESLDRRAERHPPQALPAPVTSGGDIRRDQEMFDDRLVEALRELEETARQCVLLRTVMDLSYAEIARTLGIPEGTAASHVHRARRALRARLSEGDSRRGVEGTRSGS